VKQREESLAILSELIEMAKADNVVKETEYAFLLGVAVELGISGKTVDKLIQSTPTQEQKNIPENRVLQFHRLIVLMNIDSQRHHLETDKLQVIGLRMGLKPSVVLALIKEIEEFPGGMLPIEILSKYIQ